MNKNSWRLRGVAWGIARAMFCVMFRAIVKASALALHLLCLGACSGDGDFADLRDFMRELADQPQELLATQPEPAAHASFTYSATDQPSPFEPAIATPTTTAGQVNGAPATNNEAQQSTGTQSPLLQIQKLYTPEPLQTEFFAVKYANADDIFKLFQNSAGALTGAAGAGGGGIVSDRGRVLVDDRTNSIIIIDTQPRIATFRYLLDKLDVPVRQVLIEARIVTASSTFSQNIGVRWGALGSDGFNSGQGSVQYGGSLATLGEIRSDGKSSLGDDGLIVDLGQSGPSSFAFGLLNKNFLLELELDAMETEGKGEVIARPKVITADKREASIASGSQIPYQEAAASGATSTSFIDAVLGLRVRPRITPDDRILMELNVSQDSIGEIFNGVPSINTNSIETQVLVNDGQTIVLGGVFNTTTTSGVSKTPFFGDLPVLGRLFRSKSRTESKSELLIFITPRLLRDKLASR
ncbi:MAG: type IV pilus secretin PilQ [Pseudomonadales bacterium]